MNVIFNNGEYKLMSILLGVIINYSLIIMLGMYL